MSLSAADKAKLLSHRKKGLMPTGLYLYNPASDKWIPAQCDDEGRLVIDPSDLDTRYHKKGEDLDLENHHLYNVDIGFFQSIGGSVVAMAIRPKIDLWGRIVFQSWDGSGFVDCLLLKGEGWGNVVDIPRAGDIIVLPTKNITLSAATPPTAVLNAIGGWLTLPDTRPAIPVANTVRYNAATDTFEIYDGSAWKVH